MKDFKNFCENKDIQLNELLGTMAALGTAALAPSALGFLGKQVGSYLDKKAQESGYNPSGKIETYRIEALKSLNDYKAQMEEMSSKDPSGSAQYNAMIRIVDDAIRNIQNPREYNSSGYSSRRNSYNRDNRNITDSLKWRRTYGHSFKKYRISARAINDHFWEQITKHYNNPWPTVPQVEAFIDWIKNYGKPGASTTPPPP